MISFLIGVGVGVVGTLGALWLIVWQYTRRANRQPRNPPYDPDTTTDLPRIPRNPG